MTTPLVALIYPPSLRKSLTEEALARQTASGTDYSLCLVVERLEEIPTLTNLLFLIKVWKWVLQSNMTKPSLYIHRHFYTIQSATKGTFGVLTLQYIESSSLSSDVLRAIQPDVAAQTSPALHMVKVSHLMSLSPLSHDRNS